MKSCSQHWQNHSTMTQNTMLMSLIDSNNRRAKRALGNHRSDALGFSGKETEAKGSLSQGPHAALAG